MLLDNSIKNSRGQIIGFRCTKCGNIHDRMWGNICNLCRDAQKRHNELLQKIQELINQK